MSFITVVLIVTAVPVLDGDAETRKQDAVDGVAEHVAPADDAQPAAAPDDARPVRQTYDWSRDVDERPKPSALGPSSSPLSLNDALLIVGSAAAGSVVFGFAALVPAFAISIAISAGYGALLILPVAALIGGTAGIVTGTELGVALFGDPVDHGWVSIGAVTGAAVGILCGWARYRSAATEYSEALVLLSVGFMGGAGAGAGVALLARHPGDRPGAPWPLTGALLGVGTAAMLVGGTLTALGPASNDSRAGIDDAVAPAVMVGGAVILAAGALLIGDDAAASDASKE